MSPTEIIVEKTVYLLSAYYVCMSGALHIFSHLILLQA